MYATSASASFAPPPPGSACRLPARQRRSPAPCSPSSHRRGRGLCGAPRARAARAPSRRRRSTRASRAPRRAAPRRTRAPSRPSRRVAFKPSPAPCLDQSSVPSTPKARSAFGKKRSSTPGHSGPSSTAFSSAVRSRKELSPSGERGRRREIGVDVAQAVAREVGLELRMHRPADPERVPGTEHVVEEAGLGQLLGLDRAAEPSLRSSTHTSQPAFASRAAHARPLIPSRRRPRRARGQASTSRRNSSSVTRRRSLAPTP